MVIKISPAELLKVRIEDVAQMYGNNTWNPTHTSGSVEPAGLPMQQPALVKHGVGEQGRMQALCGTQVKMSQEQAEIGI